MSKLTLKEIDDLLAHQVITEETAKNIINFYQQKAEQSGSRLIIVFGILGSLLVGMGMVLIIAHNWDMLPKFSKLIIALSPLLVGQLICSYLLWKNITSQAWREGVSVFLIFAVAVSISIVSQVYNISGDLSSFLFVWMLLSIPVVYVMRSSMASLLCWIGVSWLGCQANYFNYNGPRDLLFWGLLAAITPWYIRLIRNNPQSNYTFFHHWVVASSLTILLGTLADHNQELMLPVYLNLLGIFLLIGQLPFFTKQKLLTNAYLITGSLGTLGILLSLSFDWFWDDISGYNSTSWLGSFETIIFIVLLAAALYLLYVHHKIGDLRKLISKSFVFLIFTFLFAIGINLPEVSQTLLNVLILALAVYTVREGANADKLWQMNYGLLILTALIICRFFDSDLSFVVRGLLFVSVGLGFFGVNYWMVQKRKKEQPVG
ncbi:MAG: DUF2157 domain-containing protein [Bacteroidia bacterium]|nr:DUF2157 domain-containing protein [Bacteroidia bacterium]